MFSEQIIDSAIDRRRSRRPGVSLILPNSVVEDGDLVDAHAAESDGPAQRRALRPSSGSSGTARPGGWSAGRNPTSSIRFHNCSPSAAKSGLMSPMAALLYHRRCRRERRQAEVYLADRRHAVQVAVNVEQVGSDPAQAIGRVRVADLHPRKLRVACGDRVGIACLADA